MAKSSKKRKNGPEKVLSVMKKLKPDVSVDPVLEVQDKKITEGDMIGGIVFQDELDTTTDTLLLLAKNPSLIGFKALKPFKTAVHDYWRVAHEITNTGACVFHIGDT